MPEKLTYSGFQLELYQLSLVVYANEIIYELFQITPIVPSLQQNETIFIFFFLKNKSDCNLCNIYQSHEKVEKNGEDRKSKTSPAPFFFLTR